MHMEDIADDANGYTREENHSPRRATKYDDLSNKNKDPNQLDETLQSRREILTTKEIRSRFWFNRPKTGYMTRGNDDKITANKDKQTPPLLPGGKGRTTESGTNLQTNKATELIAKKETTMDLAVNAINAINATPNQMRM